MSYETGTILLNKYRIESLIGQGAFGDVYLVKHLELNVFRALKILKQDSLKNLKDAQDRFELEARLGAKFNYGPQQSHLLHVYDLHKTPDFWALELEYAPGKSLADKIEGKQKSGKLLEIEEAICIALSIAEGLSALHNADIVHRDIKPSNILFDSRGKAKVADLGLAQIPHGPSMRSQLSNPGSHPGTPGYMSPEQEDSRKYLQPASDVYTLGIVLFEMLTGRVYSSQKKGTRAKSFRTEIPAWLDDLLAEILAVDPEKRPWTGKDVADRLRSGQQGINLPMNPIPVAINPLSIPKINPHRQLSYPRSKKKSSWQLAAFALLAIMLVGVIGYNLLGKASSPGPNPTLTASQLTGQAGEVRIATQQAALTSILDESTRAVAEITATDMIRKATDEAATQSGIQTSVAWVATEHQSNIWTAEVPTATTTPPPSSTPVLLPSNTPAKPDLVIASALNNQLPDCVLPSYTMMYVVTLRNQGAGDAGAFAVNVLGSWRQVTRLGAGQSVSLSGIPYSGDNSITLDVNNQVDETNEENNSNFGNLLVPSQPPICTNTPTITIAPTKTPTLTPYPMKVPQFNYPLNGQSIIYEDSYGFQVKPISYATGFLWSFQQNGQLVWENWRDEGSLSGADYWISNSNQAHSRFSPGPLLVSVRAQINGQFSDAATITVQLVQTPTITPSPTITPTKPAPSAPILLSPSDGSAINANTAFSFTWNISTDAESYYTEYSGSSSNNSGWISGTNWNVAGLGPGTYSWRAKARNSSGESAWGGPWTLTISVAQFQVRVAVGQSSYSTGNQRARKTRVIASAASPPTPETPTPRTDAARGW